MPSNFEWKTEEDIDWENLQKDSPSEQPPSKRGRWLLIVAIILLISGLGTYLYFQVDQRIDENTEAMRSDVISSHNLLRLAEVEQDDELFFSLLSGRDNSWTATQHKLFQSQSLRNREPFGLQIQLEGLQNLNEDIIPEISFSPDLLIADVTTLLPYEINIGNGLTETVTLQETVQYRLGRERWLLSPPDQEFWGPQESLNGTRIKISYPQRDKNLAERLLSDLDRKLDEMCGNLVDFECDATLFLHLVLSTDPQTLVDAARPEAALLTNQGLEMNLPTPTLIGIPLNETGYQALFRGYAAQLASSLISQQIGYECCQQLPFQQALIDYQLNQLALKPWPINDEIYGQVLSEQIRLEEIAPLWNSEDPQDLYGPDGWRVYVLIDYLLNTLPNKNPVVLQRELVRRGSFAGWLNGLFEEERTLKNSALISELARSFWMRGYMEVLNNPEGLPIEPPAQDLYLPCSIISSGGTGGQTSTLYQFDFETNGWANIYETPSKLWTASLPGDDMILQQEYIGEDQSWADSLRGKGQPLMPLSGNEELTVSFAQSDPSATGLTGFVFGEDRVVAIITWFDLQNCTEIGGCPSRELPGIPIWSPNGERALFTSDPGSQFELLNKELQTIMLSRSTYTHLIPLYIGERMEFLEGEPLTEAQGLLEIANGYAPFWIDNDTFGYVTGDGDPIIQQSSRVMSKTVNQNDPQLLFTLQDIAEEIEDSFNALRLYRIHYVLVHPDNPHQLFVVVLANHNWLAHVLSFDRTTKETKYLMSTGFRANHSLGISPTGRYLILTGVDEDDADPTGSSTLMVVFDLEKEETIPFLTPTSDFRPFSPYDWSVDGQWLAILLDEGTVGLVSLDQEYLQLLKTPPGNCRTPTWMNR